MCFSLFLFTRGGSLKIIKSGAKLHPTVGAPRNSAAKAGEFSGRPPSDGGAVGAKFRSTLPFVKQRCNSGLICYSAGLNFF